MQTASYKSPHEWLVSLVMFLATLICVICAVEMAPQIPFAILSVNIAFDYHFVVPYHPHSPPL